ncbi:MAG: hypothetical protein AMXMBFR13_33470 [Phycisphaerae bacterium]
MAYRDSKAALRALYDVATAQGGHFTAKQAAAAGYGKRHLDYHVKAGNFERIEHGLYRLPTIPLSQQDDLIRLSLWSRNREDEPQAVVSHETALFLHDLSDVLPPKTHVTVPTAFRKPAPAGCVLHKALLAESEIEAREGFRVTTPLKTLLDVAASGVPAQHLERAIRDALDRGLIRRTALVAAIRRNPKAKRLADVRALSQKVG